MKNQQQQQQQAAAMNVQVDNLGDLIPEAFTGEDSACAEQFFKKKTQRL